GGAKLHRIDIHKDPSYGADTRRTFGDYPLYLAFTKDLALLALGDGGLEALKQALTAEPKSAPPVQLDMAIGRLVAGPRSRDPQAFTKAAEAAFGRGTGSDALSLRVTGGKALTVRFEMKTPVLKFLGTIGNAAAGP